MQSKLLAPRQRTRPNDTNASSTDAASRNQLRGPERAAIVSMYLGLALTVAAIVVLYVDHVTGDVLARHIRAGYPEYSPARIDTAVTTWLICLSLVGVFGTAGWLWTIWTVKTRKLWARVAATCVCATGMVVAIFDLLVKDTSGEPGLPPLLGWAGMLPCLAGLLAITLLWRAS